MGLTDFARGELPVIGRSMPGTIDPHTGNIRDAERYGIPTTAQDVLFGQKQGPSIQTIPLPEDLQKLQESARAQQQLALAEFMAPMGDPRMATRRLAAIQRELERQGIQKAQRRAELGLEAQMQGLRGSTQDAVRQLQSNVARRGLQGSSVGLAAEAGLQQRARQGLAALQAQRAGIGELAEFDLRGLRTRDPLREMEASQEKARKRAAFAGQILGQPGIKPDTAVLDPARRQGGIANLVGGAIGTYFGGASGGMAGAQIGEGLKSSF